jgi:hypothetical protein
MKRVMIGDESSRDSFIRFLYSIYTVYIYYIIKPYIYIEWLEIVTFDSIVTLRSTRARAW